MSDPRRDVRDDEDEALSALLDGALPPREERSLRERLAADAALRRRLDALRAADAAVRAAYAPVADEPLPESVLQRLRAADDDHRIQGSRRGGVENRDGAGAAKLRPRARRRRPFRFSSAIAAGVALAVGIVVSYAVLTPRHAAAPADLIASGGIVERGTVLHDVLERGASAAAVDLPAAATATPRLTFVSAAGEYCRQIDVASARRAAHAIACRSAGGEWRLELASFAAAPSAPASDGVYRPASESPATAPSALDAAIAAMIEGAPLGRAEERAAIARQWAPAGRDAGNGERPMR